MKKSKKVEKIVFAIIIELIFLAAVWFFCGNYFKSYTHEYEVHDNDRIYHVWKNNSTVVYGYVDEQNREVEFSRNATRILIRKIENHEFNYSDACLGFFFANLISLPCLFTYIHFLLDK